MRDALSLTDQAVSYGGGSLRERDVLEMLGSDRPRRHRAVAGRTGCRGAADVVLDHCATLAEQAVDFAEVLGALLSTLHAVAIAQAVRTNDSDDRCDGATFRRVDVA